MIHYVRPSMVLCADDCRRQMFFRYRVGIKTEATPANLAFGTAIDVADKQYVASLITGQPIDPVAVFRDNWNRACREKVIAYSKEQSPEKLLKIGERLMELLPQAWEDTGLVTLMGGDGKLNLSRRMEVAIAPNIILTGEIDKLCVTSNGQSALLDLKTCSQESDTDFIRNSDQLTPYEILCDANRESVGTEKIDLVGLWEFLKRNVPENPKKGKGPEILAPKLVEPRSQKTKAEYRQKVIWLVEDIERGRFPKASRSPHNSPCKLCDYVRYCSEGDAEGLVIPASAQQALKLVA